MKRFWMLVAVATVAGAMYVAAAPGSRQAAAPSAKQFAALKRQVATLSKTLKALKTDEGKVKSVAADAGAFIADCFLPAGVVPVSQFGDTSGTYGFEYVGTPGAPSSAATPRTGLDIDGGSAPQGFLQAVDSSCVSSSGAAAHALMRSSGSHLPARAERPH